MPQASARMETRKRIALIAHDNRKVDLLAWARYNKGTLSRHRLYGTGTTGGMLEAEPGLAVTRFKSGPPGGAQQVGAAIAQGATAFVTSSWDPLQPHPPAVDVKP